MTPHTAYGQRLTQILVFLACASSANAGDHWADLQFQAIENVRAEFGHWGVNPANYLHWSTHSNRLIPVYTFGTLDAGPGIDLRSYLGENSPYRNQDELLRIYERSPVQTVNGQAEYCDQTNIFDMQRAALAAGRKQIILVVFDGMDWQTTRAAAIAKTGQVAYDSGRGTGLHFQDYTAGETTQFGWFVSSPHNEGTTVDINAQTVKLPGGTIPGGYDFAKGGAFPWSNSAPLDYIIQGTKADPVRHAVTDSSSSATSLTAGLKTYNNGVNVTATGEQIRTIAHIAQAQGYKVGAVTSVPLSHATPACAYAHNVDRDDYQDLTRDMLGLPSISHPERPLPGLDVVIGTGWGATRDKDSGQGDNYVPGNAALTAADLLQCDVAHGGRYVVSQRTAGIDGGESLQASAELAAQTHQRLLGFYGVAETLHLPFATADGDYQPVMGRSGEAETYTPADLAENPTLPEMTRSALAVLSAKNKEGTSPGFWLMVEAGDVDWANHDNNIDNSIGAVLSGDAAVQVITDWVEANSNWQETLLIVTADHGHYLVLERPELLIKPH